MPSSSRKQRQRPRARAIRRCCLSRVRRHRGRFKPAFLSLGEGFPLWRSGISVQVRFIFVIHFDGVLKVWCSARMYISYEFRRFVPSVHAFVFRMLLIFSLLISIIYRGAIHLHRQKAEEWCKQYLCPRSFQLNSSFPCSASPSRSCEAHHARVAHDHWD